MAKHGYKETRTPGIFLHETRPISFTLVVDDFGIKYPNPNPLTPYNTNTNTNTDPMMQKRCAIFVVGVVPVTSLRLRDGN
jgi:hypothetical protein